jgi:hypothetical protein
MPDAEAIIRASCLCSDDLCDGCIAAKRAYLAECARAEAAVAALRTLVTVHDDAAALENESSPALSRWGRIGREMHAAVEHARNVITLIPKGQGAE